jgi:hypothetical protein
MAEVQIESKSHYDATEVNQSLHRPHRLRCQRFLEQVNDLQARIIWYMHKHKLCVKRKVRKYSRNVGGCSVFSILIQTLHRRPMDIMKFAQSLSMCRAATTVQAMCNVTVESVALLQFSSQFLSLRKQISFP